MKKHYVAELSDKGCVVGSIIATIWIWQSAKLAYSSINKAAGNYGVVNFRRVK